MNNKIKYISRNDQVLLETTEKGSGKLLFLCHKGIPYQIYEKNRKDSWGVKRESKNKVGFNIEDLETIVKISDIDLLKVITLRYRNKNDAEKFPATINDMFQSLKSKEMPLGEYLSEIISLVLLTEGRNSDGQEIRKILTGYAWRRVILELIREVKWEGVA